MEVSRKLGGKSHVVNNFFSSNEQEINRTTSTERNSFEFDFQTNRDYYLDLRQTFLASKCKLVNVSGYKTCKTKESEKEHREEGKMDAEKEEYEAPVPLLIHVNNTLHSIFSNVEVYIKNQQFYNSNGLYAHKS